MRQHYFNVEYDIRGHSISRLCHGLGYNVVNIVSFLYIVFKIQSSKPDRNRCNYQQHDDIYEINTTGASSGAETAYTSGAHESTPSFFVVFVLFNFYFSVQCFIDRCLSLCPFSSVFLRFTTSAYHLKTILLQYIISFTAYVDYEL